MSENLVGSDVSETVGLTFNLESETVVAGDPRFPNIAVPCHLLRLERGVSGVFKKKSELLFYSLLQVLGQARVVPIKGFLGFEVHTRCWSK